MQRIQKLLLAIIVIATGLFFLAQEIEPKTDGLWFHFIGIRSFEPERAEAVISSLAVSGNYETLEVARREVARFNYPLNTVSAYIGDIVAGADLPLAVGIGFALPSLVGAALFLFAAFRTPWVGGLIFATGYFALTARLPGPILTDHLLYYGDFRDLLNLIVVIVNPGGSLSPLSIQPKSTVYLIFMVALALRWSDRRPLAYAVMALPILWHITFTIAVLGLLAAVDIVSAYLKRHSMLTDTVLAAGGSLAGAAGLSAFYLVVRGGMVWGVESAAIQLATRLIMLAEVAAITYAGCRVWQWLIAHTDGQEARVTVATGALIAAIAVYSAAGMGWEKGRYYQQRFADTSLIAQYGPLATYYHEALIRLLPARHYLFRPSE